MGEVEFYETGSGDGEDEQLARPHNRAPRRAALFTVAAIALGVVAVVATRGTGSTSGPRAAVSPAASADPTPSGVAPSVPVGLPTGTPQLDVATVAAPVLGVRGGWELFGRGDGVVTRIELARGRVTTTVVPALRSTGGVSFVVGPTSALVRPFDYVPGYTVADAHPARELSGILGASGPAFPGPAPGQIWVPDGESEPHRMVLVSADGRPLGRSLALPTGGSPLTAVPDGTGYLVFPELDSGAYRAGPTGVTRITTGTVLAVGPTRWLTWECGPPGRCSVVAIDRATGGRHRLATPPVTGSGPTGVISPDGTEAALVAGATSPRLELLDLATGAARTLPLPVDVSAPNGQSMVWSPASRYVFAVGADRHVYAVDPESDDITDLTDLTKSAIPPMSQLAIRAAPAG